MSFLMAEMYDIDLAHHGQHSLDNFGSCGFKAEDALIIYNAKRHKARKSKKMEEIKVYLEIVLQRVGNLLAGAGLSPELPEPDLLKEKKWGNNTFAVRPPSSCQVGEQNGKLAPNAESKSCIDDLLCTFLKTSTNRDQILMEIVEWFASTDDVVGEQTQHIFDKALRKRCKDEEISLEELEESLKLAEGAVKRLHAIGRSLFEDKDDSHLTSEPSAINSNMAARLNARVRRASAKLDAIPTIGRATAMKSIFLPKNLPDDIKSLQSTFDEEDAEEKKMLNDVSRNWHEVCDEVREIVISVHELKMMKRATKLAIRRALYCFKLIVALLEQKSVEVKQKDSNLIKLRAESHAYNNKIEYLHKEVKTWREKMSESLERCSKLSSEVESLEGELTASKRQLNDKEVVITGLRHQITVLEDEVKKREKYEQAPVELHDETKHLIEELTALSVNRGERIAELESKLETIATVHSEELKTEKLNLLNSTERVATVEEKLKVTSFELQACHLRADGLEEALNMKNDTLSVLERDLSTIKNEMSTKDELLEKLKTVTINEDLEPNAILKRRGSIRPRRTSIRRPSLAIKKSADILPVEKSSTMVIPKPDNKAGAEKEEEPQKSLLPKPSNMFALSSASQARLQVVRSRSKLALAIPVNDIAANTNEEKGEVNDPPPLVIPPARPQEQRRSVNTVNSREYKRVVAELKESKNETLQLQKEVDELMRELEVQEERFDQAQLDLDRQHRVRMLLEEDKLKNDTANIYEEYLKMEIFFNKFKTDMASLLERGLMTAAAKEARSAYKYIAAVNPPNCVASVKAMNERFSDAFDIFLRALNMAVNTMKRAKLELRKRSIDELGLETVHHLKVLAEKTQANDELKIKVCRLNEEINKLKNQQQIITKENVRLVMELRNITTEKENALASLRELEQEGTRMVRRRTVFAPDEKPQTKEALEATLMYAKEQQIKLKRRLIETEVLLEKERVSRLRMEKALLAQSKNESKPEQHNLFIAQVENAKLSTEHLEARATNTAKYVKALEQIHKMNGQAKKNLDPKLMAKAELTTKVYHESVHMRLVALIRRYYLYARYKNAAFNSGSEVLSCLEESQVESSMFHHKDKDAKGIENRHQKCFWKLESRRRQILQERKEIEACKKRLDQSRGQILSVFRQVGHAIVTMKRREMQEGSETGDFMTNFSRESVIIAPSNSEFSQDLLSGYSETGTSVASENKAEERQNSTLNENVTRELPNPMTAHPMPTNQRHVPSAEQSTLDNSNSTAERPRNSVEHSTLATRSCSIFERKTAPSIFLKGETSNQNYTKSSRETECFNSITEKSNSTTTRLNTTEEQSITPKAESFNPTTERVNRAEECFEPTSEHSNPSTEFLSNSTIAFSNPSTITNHLSSTNDLIDNDCGKNRSYHFNMHKTVKQKKNENLNDESDENESNHDSFSSQPAINSPLKPIKVFSRRLQNFCCQMDRKTDPIRTSLQTKFKPAYNEDDTNSWIRRRSLPLPARRQGNKSRTSSATSPNKEFLVCELPRTLEMEVRQDLRQVRKNLQYSMRHYFTTPATDCIESTETRSDQEKGQMQKKRRQTIAFLGLEKSTPNHNIPIYDSEHLCEIAKSQCYQSSHSGDLSFNDENEGPSKSTTLDPSSSDSGRINLSTTVVRPCSEITRRDNRGGCTIPSLHESRNSGAKCNKNHE